MRFSSISSGARRSSRAASAALAAALLVAGCSGPADGSDETGSINATGNQADAAAGRGGSVDNSIPDALPASDPFAPEAEPPDATVGGDGSAVHLTPLSAAEIEDARLSGELGCSFSTSAASPILVAMGNVASTQAAQGVVKVGDYVERVSAPGGFDAMPRGTTFSGAGKTIRIALTGPAIGGGESPPRPATLTYDRADGARRTFAGRWECGP